MIDIVGILSIGDGEARWPDLDKAFSAKQWPAECHSRRTVEGKRLRALCLSRTGQPPGHAHADARYLFVVGEVYPRSDAAHPIKGRSGPLTAVELLRVYTEQGSSLMQAIKGNFTLVVVDENRMQCSVYNSRFGISPFYYAWDGQRFSFSTSLVALARCLTKPPDVDRAAVAELALFNYPLGSRSYFEGVRMLRPAEAIRATRTGLKQEWWWDVRTLYHAPLLPRRQALETGSVLFRKTVNDLARHAPQICVSFTSGFDSRAILAVLEKDRDQVLTYAFGIPGSLNVSIPEQISDRLGIQFLPIYLNGDYERAFEQYAFQAMLFSDNLSTVERANFPYAYERLSAFSPAVITGLFGSELMRTFQNVGYTVSANLVRLNLAEDPDAELEEILSTPREGGYFRPEVIHETGERIQADVSAVLMDRFGDMPPDQRFYMFLLTEGLRKYFGAEIHMERVYGTNRYPFLDDEFVEFAFRAPFAGVYSRTLRPTVGNRFRSQYFYAYLIREYRPELLKEPTDHGHSPTDVLSPVALLRIVPKVLHWRWRRQRTGYREFRTEEWTEALYRRHLFQRPLLRSLLAPSMKEDFSTGEWKARRLEFARAASLKLWLEMIGLEVD